MDNTEVKTCEPLAEPLTESATATELTDEKSAVPAADDAQQKPKPLPTNMHELITSIPRTDVTAGAQRRYIERVVKPHGVRLTYDPNNGRVACCTTARHGPFTDGGLEFIGAVIDLNDENNHIRNKDRSRASPNPTTERIAHAPAPRVLALIPQPPSNQYDTKMINSAFDEKTATVYPLYDGTAITLYWWQGRWVFATIGSYDYGNMTFSVDPSGIPIYNNTIIHDVLKECKFDLSTLNKDYCYTLMFNTPRMHQFRPSSGGSKYETSSRLLFIRIVDMKSYNEALVNGPCDVEQFIVAATGRKANIVNPVQDITMDSIISTNAEALDMYRKNKLAVMGFIVRIGRRSYIMESSLYSMIRNMFYDIPIPGSRHDKHRSHFNITRPFYVDRVKYGILYSCLNPDTADAIKQLCPHLTPTIDRINKRLSVICNDFDRMYAGYVGSLNNHAIDSGADTRAHTRPRASDADGKSQRGRGGGRGGRGRGRGRNSRGRRSPNEDDRCGMDNSAVRDQSRGRYVIPYDYRPLWYAMLKRLPHSDDRKEQTRLIASFLVNVHNARALYALIFSDIVAATAPNSRTSSSSSSSSSSS